MLVRHPEHDFTILNVSDKRTTTVLLYKFEDESINTAFT